MGFTKIKSSLDIDLPNPPLPGPTQHAAIEKNRDKEGGFAQTLAERFPFGLVIKENANTLKFNWGEENFQFIEDMLQSNENMQRLYLKWSTHSENEKRIYLRQVQKDIEEQWFYYLQDHHRFLIDIEKNRDLVENLRIKFMLFDRVGDRFFDNRNFFMSRIIQAQHIRQDDKRFYDKKIMKNPYDTRIEPPGKNIDYKLREKNVIDDDFVWELRDKFHKNEDVFVDSHKRKMISLLDLHQKDYAAMPQFEKMLIDKRPEHARYGWEQTPMVVPIWS